MRPSPTAAAVVLLLAALYVLPLTMRFPLLDPDEGLHAAITQEMIARGDYVMPRFMGEPFLDKPILFFWAQAASMRVFGEHEPAARLPGLFFGALGALTTGWLAATVLGLRAGWVAALFHTTLLVPMALMQVPVHDIALVPFTNAALVAFWRASRAPATRAVLAWSLGAGVALGFAILTKGLTGVAIVGLAHGTVLLLERRLTLAVAAGGILALVVSLAIASPWYLAMEQVQPGYLHYYFVERHLFGFATETQRHGSRPWTYYIPVVIGGGLPWILYVPLAWGRRAAATPGNHADARRLGWAWLFTGWAFLSIAGSKLFTYALPIFPAIALLAAVVWVPRWTSDPRDRRDPSWLVVVQAVICAVLLPLTLAGVSRTLPLDHPVFLWTIAGLVALGWAWAVRLWRARARGHAATLAAVLGAVTVATLLAGVMPAVADLMSARDLSLALNRSRHLPPEVWVVRQRLGSVVFYLDPVLRAEVTPARFHQVQVADLRGLVAPAGTVVAVAVQDQGRVTPFLATPSAPYEQAGRYRLYRAEDLGVKRRD